MCQPPPGFQSSVRLGLRNFSVRSASASPLTLRLREFVIDAAVEAQRRREVLADVDVDFAALLLHGGIGDRKVDPDLLAMLVDLEQVDLVVERVVGAPSAPASNDKPSRFERVQLKRPMVSLRCARDRLLEPADSTAAPSSSSPARWMYLSRSSRLRRVASATNLIAPPASGPGDVAAELDHRIAIALDQIVVVDRRAGRADAVALEQVEAARLPAGVEADRVVGAALQRPASGDERVLVEIAVVLAPMLDQRAGLDDRSGRRSLPRAGGCGPCRRKN